MKSTAYCCRQSVEDLHTSCLLLLTGTPIQNNMSELYSVMNLVDPEKFDDPAEFLERFGNPPTTPSTPEQMLDLQVRQLRQLWVLLLCVNEFTTIRHMLYCKNVCVPGALEGLKDLSLQSLG